MSNLNVYQGSVIFCLSNKKLDPKENDFPTIELDSIEQGTGKLLELYDSKELTSQKNYFEAGQVLFGKLRPYLKKFARPNFSGLCSSEIWVMDTLNKDILSQEYLFYLVQSSAFIEAATTMAGTKMPRSSWDVVSGFNYSLPSINEQQKIVEILSDCDEAIDVCKSGISVLRTQYKGMLTALIDKSNFQVTPIKLENLTYRPISYGVLKPSDYTECGVPMLRIQDIDEEGNLISAPYLITHEQHHEYRRTELKENDLICSLVGSIGRVFNVPMEYHGGNVSRAFAVVGVKDDETRKFVEHSLRAPSFQSMVNRIATGNAQKVLNVADLKEFELSFPQNREVLFGINLALEEALGQIKVAETQLNFFKQQKRGLMQQLLTGKLFVKGAA